MKVSIIIPVYNVSKYIERCLKSVLGQTWKDLEIILVDDCTPDDSMDIVRGILETSSRSDIVTILKQRKTGAFRLPAIQASGRLQVIIFIFWTVTTICRPMVSSYWRMRRFSMMSIL